MKPPPLLRLKRLRPERDGDIPLPAYMTPGSAGMDLPAAIDTPVTLHPGETALLPTGFAMALPDGYEAQVRPRSGLAVKYGIALINSPGTIDSDYRGEIQVALINLGKKAFTVNRGDRIAQMVIQQFCRPRLTVVDSIDETGRSDGGFGHTGK